MFTLHCSFFFFFALFGLPCEQWFLHLTLRVASDLEKPLLAGYVWTVTNFERLRCLNFSSVLTWFCVNKVLTGRKFVQCCVMA